MTMRFLRLGMLGIVMCVRMPAPLLPGPNLAKRIEQADAIVVARLTSGTTLASGTRVSSDFMLHVDRVLKGDVIPGSDIAAHLEGRVGFIVQAANQSAISEKLYGIWLLSSAASGPYSVVSRDGNLGDLDFAPVILPEDAPVGKAGETPAASVANELVAGLEWLNETHGSQLSPRATGVYAGQYRALADDLRSLDSSTTLDVYRQLASAKSALLRALGIQGLIAANDPEGVKRAAADWTELSAAADVSPISNSLMAYSNGDDAEAVRSLGALALRDPSEAGLRANAVYALRAIHSKETLPALVALLDDKDDRVRPYALSGLCLFVRNAPNVTPKSVPSMSWMQARPPTPLLNPETQRYCLLGPNQAADLDAYVSFWKSWWSEHQTEIEDR